MRMTFPRGECMYGVSGCASIFRGRSCTERLAFKLPTEKLNTGQKLVWRSPTHLNGLPGHTLKADGGCLLSVRATRGTLASLDTMLDTRERCAERSV